MRIKHLFVKDYKNLKNFSLDFDGDSFIDVFVGKNGSGKSNMFEALIEIFRHLYENDYVVEFDYKLHYVIGDNDIKIEWKWEEDKWLDETGKVTKKVTQDKLPDNILIYYSGHNPKVSELVRQYEDNFSKGLKGAVIDDARKFIGIGNEYKALLLTSLLLQPDDNKAKQYIVEKLGIKLISPEFKIVLNRPQYAKNKPADYQIDPFLPETHYWRAEGIVREFIDKLLPAINLDPRGGRKEGYFKDEDQYIHYVDIKKFNTIFSDKTIQAVFRSFDNLKTLEMLESIGIEVKLHDKSEINIDHFSDGQFQSVYIYSIIELFKDRTCVTLLDEPDSFLHPEWQYKFLTQIIDIASHSSECNHVLMTSHSAMTLIPHKHERINLFSTLDGKLKCTTVNKSFAVDQLASKFLKYSEQEQILSIINRIGIEKKPILFTEGSTDPEILKIAWNKLYETPIPFNIVFAFNCNYLRQLIQDVRVLNELKGKPLFALFDFDGAYNEWNFIKEETILESDPYKGLAKKIKDKNSYALMLPVPHIADIEKQVIKNPQTNETFKGESELEIEHLLYGDERTHSYFSEEIIKGGGTIIKFKDDKKTVFTQEIVPTIDKEHFEVFRPMFEFIISKIN
jgi:ABC-type Mn2+/Zn2+ transport system ATPase subunit